MNNEATTIRTRKDLRLISGDQHVDLPIYMNDGEQYVKMPGKNGTFYSVKTVEKMFETRIIYKR